MAQTHNGVDKIIIDWKYHEAGVMADPREVGVLIADCLCNLTASDNRLDRVSHEAQVTFLRAGDEAHHRQSDHEPGPLSDGAFATDLSTVGLDDFPHGR